MLKSHFYYFSHYMLTFSANILIANQYSTELFGEYQFYSTFLILLVTFSQFGTLQSFVVLAPQSTNNIKLLFSTLILRLIGISLVGILAVAGLIIFNAPSLAFFVLLLIIPSTINLSSILDYYNKTEIDVKYNFFFDALFYFFMINLFLYLELSIVYVVLARFVSRTLAEFLKFHFIVKYINKFIFSKKYLFWVYRHSKVYIVNRVIVELYARSDILLLGMIGTKKEVGIYAVALTIYNGLLMGESLLSRKLFPKLTKVYHNYTKSKKVLTTSILYKSLYFIPIIILTYFILNDFVFTYLYDPMKYAKSSILLNFMLIGLISHVFANNTNFLLLLEDKYLYIKRFVIGLVLNVSLGWGLFYMYGLEGYALSIQLVKLLMVMYSVYISYNYLNTKMKEVQGV